MWKLCFSFPPLRLHLNNFILSAVRMNEIIAPSTTGRKELEEMLIGCCSEGADFRLFTWMRVNFHLSIPPVALCSHQFKFRAESRTRFTWIDLSLLLGRRILRSKPNRFASPDVADRRKRNGRRSTSRISRKRIWSFSTSIQVKMNSTENISTQITPEVASASVESIWRKLRNKLNSYQFFLVTASFFRFTAKSGRRGGQVKRRRKGLKWLLIGGGGGGLVAHRRQRRPLPRPGKQQPNTNSKENIQQILLKMYKSNLSCKLKLTHFKLISVCLNSKSIRMSRHNFIKEVKHFGPKVVKMSTRLACVPLLFASSSLQSQNDCCFWGRRRMATTQFAHRPLVFIIFS